MEKLSVFFNLLQLAGGIILSLGYIPQIIKTFTTKSVDDLSLRYYVLVFIGVLMMELYSIFNVISGVAEMFMFFVTNTISLACCGTMMVLTFKYGRKNKKEQKR